MNLCNPKVVRTIMEEAGIAFRKEYGQNFLIDVTVPERIADACADRSDVLVLEIGPGIGCLTQELALRYERVLAIEIDDGLIPVLSRTLEEYDNIRVVHGDVMKLDLATLIAEEAEGREVVVCANLPYYITTPILMRLLECGVPFSSITVMVQKEVADRLAAAPGKGDYGAITAVLSYYGSITKLFTVPAGCFMPAPKVASSVIRMDLYKEKPYTPKNEKLFFEVIRAAFGQRRKTLANALGALGGFTKEEIQTVIADLGHSPTVRGETLSCSDFVALADRLHDLRASK